MAPYKNGTWQILHIKKKKQIWRSQKMALYKNSKPCYFYRVSFKGKFLIVLYDSDSWDLKNFKIEPFPL